jgi:hypothetical protein
LVRTERNPNTSSAGTVNDDALFDPHDRFLLARATAASAR